ncbi:MAG: outer membrane protein assembly factor BamD [Ignavibacteriales bacterium]|nr:MAG: outer membrane protein assembly factor BamD [Ignavibacteriales bacterium]
MKHIFYLLFIPLIFWGCSGSIDTTNLTPEEKLNYAIELYNDEDYEEAINEFQAIILQYPGNAVVDDAQYYLAMTRYHRGEYILGGYEFSKLIKNMTASEHIPMSQFMLSECYYLLSPNFNLDQRYTKKAIEEYQAFIDFFPTHEKVAEAESKIAELNDKLAQKEFSDALIYEKLEYYTASLMYYTNVIETYHDTRYAPMAMYNKIVLLIDRDKNSEALTEINKFLARFSDDSRAEDVQKLKTSLEGKLSASN